jgi:rhomboid protease GluP
MSDQPPQHENEPAVISADMLAPATVAAAPGDRRIETRINFERGMTYWPLLTLLLILANGVVFAWQLWTGALESTEAIISAGALSRPQVLDGELWRLLSATFLHGSFDHLLGNCLMLYAMGMATEHAFGAPRAALVFAVAALFGWGLSLVMSPGPAVGASGAIFGLSGAVIVFLFRFQKTFYVRDKRIGVVLLVWGGYTILIGFLSPAIDNFAHIGGLLGGALAAASLPRRRRNDLDTPASH